MDQSEQKKSLLKQLIQQKGEIKELNSLIEKNEKRNKNILKHKLKNLEIKLTNKFK